MNEIKTDWKGFFTFLAIFLLAVLIFNFFMSYILLITHQINNPNAIMLANTIAHLLSFTGVGIAFPLLQKYNLSKYYQNNPLKSFSFFILTFFVVILIQPSLSLLTKLPGYISLPPNLENYFNQYEGIVNELLKSTLAGGGIGYLLLNIIYIAVVPAIGEELIFRGIIQRYLINFTKNAWLGIIITGLIFSLFHLSWNTILAIWFFGIILGLVYYTTGNIWYSIFIHFLNNLMAALSYWLASNELIPYTIEEIDSANFPIWAEILSLILMILFIVFLLKNIKNKREISINQ
ncbi:MAG: type II CAAX endopeptidase family protein [Bacteroidales bacterium]|jgi:membrane protease YdiL (CAAX protease family)|nr:type II CAAX endopeptidase family protein [Bacteroidales bacterium]MDI9575528.1 type II CAAX endopeptidase family protein [Bacteroidota bacterium]MDY0401609.1 type II CAAX endopeptidase family protein [Bacteroidales bacterium]HHW59069.1 CPBP family intramembrane metalloprotease [Bacteroidales bacterium]HOB78324.1 type II CAAX endopeptidase family protein [Bacteroidales bacterium]